MKWKLFVIAILAVASCKTPKQIETTPIYTPDQVEDKTDDDDTSPKDTPKDTVTVIDQPTDVPFEEKGTYNIAIILPFNVNKVPLDYLPYNIDTNIYLSSENKEALDFYMGAKICIDEFKSNNKSINVFVLDDAKSEIQAKKILSERPFPEVDIIISGSTNWISQNILDHSSAQNIPLYSPFTKTITKTNEWFFSSIPNDIFLLEQALEHAHYNYPKSNIIIIEDKNDQSSLNISKTAQSYIRKSIGVNIKVISDTNKTYTSNGDSLSFYQPTSENIVFIASNNQAFVRNTIHSMLSTSQTTHIIGMPSWKEFTNLDKGTQTHLNIKIPVIKVQSKEEDLNIFSNKFIRLYSMKENNNAYLGYDLMNYILTSLENGVLQKNPTSDEIKTTPLLYKFNFYAASSEKGVRTFVNNQVRHLKYSKGKFRIIE